MNIQKFVMSVLIDDFSTNKIKGLQIFNNSSIV